ncbi:MAG: CubicO group peptidase (beta-lactamase class C family) [Candidatus Azotimanducaceae bacterium]|jgi:CubicO group peptidase (beta-lactamase class C family)
MTFFSKRGEQVQSIADKYIEAELFSGIEWQVETNGQVLTAGSVGCSDHAQQTAIPDGAIYRIFSMTKPIVSMLALQLIEQGRLRLYDMLAQFDERFANMMVLTADGLIKPAERPITVEDLLTHRAGFTYEFIHGCHIGQYYREAEINADGSRTLDQMMGALAELPLAFQPGSNWRYSVSIDVLAHVIERATGESLPSLLAENIFSPLGMTDTAFFVPEDKRNRLMTMYGVGILDGSPALAPSPQTLEPLDVDAMYPVDQPDTFVRGGLGLYSTTEDYMAFARMLLTGKAPDGTVLLSRKMLSLAQTNRIPESQLPLNIGPSVFLGYGWGLLGRIMLDQGRASTLSNEGEFGWAGAATTYFWVDPGEQTVGVVMTQYLGTALPLSDDLRTAAYQMLS